LASILDWNADVCTLSHAGHANREAACWHNPCNLAGEHRHEEIAMEPESKKPLRLFVNPFAIWTDLAFKTAESMWASAHAAALRANATNNAPKVAVIPAAGAPAPKSHAPANELGQPASKSVKGKAKAAVREASKAARFKATRATPRSKANAKRRAKR
jgi:hypothetical protein